MDGQSDGWIDEQTNRLTNSRSHTFPEILQFHSLPKVALLTVSGVRMVSALFIPVAPHVMLAPVAGQGTLGTPEGSSTLLHPHLKGHPHCRCCWYSEPGASVAGVATLLPRRLVMSNTHVTQACSFLWFQLRDPTLQSGMGLSLCLSNASRRNH
jgi:hypothetical protein